LHTKKKICSIWKTKTRSQKNATLPSKQAYS
jgi:hypothetical protein